MNTSSQESLFLIGCNHQTAPIHTRERFAIPKDQQSKLYQAFSNLSNLQECLILNTCNRVELYGVGNDNNIKNDLLQHLYNIHKLNKQDFEPHHYNLQNLDALKHLFKVASGINSQLIGETEILGQVKSSYQEAQKHSMAGKILHLAMQKSFQAAKWIRTNTAIGSGQISVGSVTKDLALRMFDSLKDVRILVVGSGEIAESTLHSLHLNGANDIVITNRTFQKAQYLAESIGGMAIDFSNFPSQLHHFDIIISSTSSPITILNNQILKATQSIRSYKPLFLIDLAVPRDICHTAASLPNTYLYNIDDLAKIANQNLNARKSELQKCHSFLEQKALHTWNKISS